MKKFRRRIGIFLLVLFFLLLLFVYSFNTLVPIINARAVQYSKSHATRVINSAVKEVLEVNSMDYSDLVSINTDEQGNVLSVSSDIVNINNLKSDISLRILDMMSLDDNSVLKIPVGNLSGMYILSGRGFKLSIRLIPTDSVITDVSSEFSEVGINQSWHRIRVNVTLKLGVIILGEHNAVEINDSIVVADTIIVGKVPDAYTSIKEVDSETVGDIIDFKAE